MKQVLLRDLIRCRNCKGVKRILNCNNKEVFVTCETCESKEVIWKLDKMISMKKTSVKKEVNKKRPVVRKLNHRSNNNRGDTL